MNNMLNTTSLAIDAHLLSKSFTTQAGELRLFSDISFSIKSGESVAIIGQSGAGKSTLLSLLAGLDTPTQGNIKLLDTDLNSLSDQARSAWRAQHISFIFQSFHLLPELSALENIRLPLEILGDKQATAKAQQLLTQVGLAERADHIPAQLSGGEQQRVAIARAFVTQPSILFADEPTGNLDSVTGDAIIQQLFTLNKTHQTTLVLITHDASLATLCDRQFCLEKGSMTEVQQ